MTEQQLVERFEETATANETMNTSFRDPSELRDGDLELICTRRGEADEEKGLVPWYEFSMRRVGSDQDMGKISLRLGNTPHLVSYGGHMGYRVEEPFRGHRHAARSIRLLLPLAKEHELSPLWITCDPDNAASRRSCELAGGVLVEIVDLPPDTDLYKRGLRQVCRYKFDV